jgi:hypothetical protein
VRTPDLGKRFSELSPARQYIMRVFQILNFGRVERLQIRHGEPVVAAETVMIADIKLGDDTSRDESGLADFALSKEACALMIQFDQIFDGELDVIVVQAGLPRRVVVRSKLPEPVR